MNDAGYTLVEMLVALTIVGLAIGGFLAGADQLERIQAGAATSAAQASQAAERDTAFARFFESEGPFPSDDAKAFSGASDHLSFGCSGHTCSANLTRVKGVVNLVLERPNGASESLPIGRGAYVFSYFDGVQEDQDWPSPGSHEPRTLQSIMIIEPRLGGDRPVAQARVWADQPSACAFDLISKRCRAETTP